MKSTIHLFNTALGRLGGEQIPLNRSPQEHDAVGILCHNLFPHVLDMVFTAHEWGFAKRRVVLAELPLLTPANPAYRYSYALPVDCLKPVRLEGLGEAASGNVFGNISGGASSPDAHGPGPAYVIEGRSLSANLEQAVLLYVARLEDPLLWPSYFAEALAWALAGELASARNNDTSKQQWCYQNYEIALAKAAAKDRAMQNPQARPSGWMAARGAGMGYVYGQEVR